MRGCWYPLTIKSLIKTSCYLTESRGEWRKQKSRNALNLLGFNASTVNDGLNFYRLRFRQNRVFCSPTKPTESPANLVFTGLFCFLPSKGRYCQLAPAGGIFGGMGVFEWGYRQKNNPWSALCR